MAVRFPMIRALALALSVTALTVGPVAAQEQKRGPSTPEERAAALEMIRLIREKPLTKEAREAREKVLFWLIQIPDISVGACSDLVPGLVGSKAKNSSELFTQTILEQATFYIEHPDRKDDRRGAFATALEGVLQMYENILSKKPKDHNKPLDALKKLLEEGKLEQHLDAAVEKCS